MTPAVVAERQDGAEAWVTRKNADGTHTGFLLLPNQIRREVADLRKLISLPQWTPNSAGRKILKAAKASEPKMFNNPAFDAPFRKAPKPKQRKRK